VREVKKLIGNGRSMPGDFLGMPGAEAIRLPAEWEPHAYCWMAWAVHGEWRTHADEVKRELREVIATVAEYEPVRLLTPPDQIIDAKRQLFGGNVEIVPAPVDDIWMRDIAPTVAFHGDDVVAVDWNFNGWGGATGRRSRPGDRLAGFISANMALPVVHAPFIAEGGALVTDGEGTFVTTKSCLLNENRNPAFGRSPSERMDEIEGGLTQLGGRKTIWLEGDATEPVTSGHVDAYVLFARSGSILVEGVEPVGMPIPNRVADIGALRAAEDARGRELEITTILPPRQSYCRFSGGSFAPCYLNAYVANGAVMTAKFGDPERDEEARKALVCAFPGRAIRMLDINHIAAGGGGIHCLTQPVPISSRLPYTQRPNEGLQRHSPSSTIISSIARRQSRPTSPWQLIGS
jgi:agmatine deiminase